MQVKIKRGNLNPRDRARNMRGVIDANIPELKRSGVKREAEERRDINREVNYLPDEEEQVKSLAKVYSEIKDFKEYENFKFVPLFENNRIIVIDKPAGIMVHPDGRGEEVAISDIVHYNYGDMKYVGEIDKPGIVHRLDRNTTGCLVLAKTQDAFKDMKVLFREHKVKKVYRAVVEGNIRDDMGIIDSAIARARSDFRKRSVVDMFSKDFRGEKRDAITRYKVIERSKDKKFTYVELYPVTGRTHQLRVHMRSIRHPIIGDDLYGSNNGKELCKRSMLHAHKIEFTLRKELISVISPVPKDMQEVLAKYFTS